MAPRTSDTRGQVQQQVEHDVDREIENKGMWARIFATITRDHTVQERVDNQMADQARALRAGVEVRPGPVLRCSNYQACPHPELQKMVTEDVDPGVVGDMGELWIQAGTQMSQFQTDVSQATTSSTADWRGRSGDSARKFMVDVGNWIGKAGTSAQLAGTQTQQYSMALENAKNGMPEPVDFDVDQANADLSRTTDPFAYITKYTSYMARHEEQQNAHQEAVQVLGTYDSILGGSSTMPAFAPPPAMSGDTNGDDGQNPDDGTNPGDGNGRIPGGGSPPIPGGPGGTASGTGNGPGQEGSTPTPGGMTSGGTTPGGTGTDTQGFAPGNRPGGFGNQGGNNPGSGIPGSGNLGGGSSGGVNLGVGSGDSGFGSGGGAGGSGAGGPGGGPGAGGRGSGAGGGAGVGGFAAEQSAGGRGAATGARGATGIGPMGGTGAGRGQGGEDDEHQRPSYLVEPDPDSVFGSDEVTAPPVIGG